MRTRVIAILLALLVAIVGAVAVISYAHKADDRAVAGQKVREVYITAKLVPQGTSEKDAVDQGLITRQKVVAKGVPDGALSSVGSNASDVVALDDIPAGAVVLAAGFGPQSEVQTTSGVPRGEVAISIGLSDQAGIRTYLKRGSHIAIYDSFNIGKLTGTLTPEGTQLSVQGTKVRATAVLLPDVEVLNVAVAKNGSGSTASSSPTGGSMRVTVAVTPHDAPRLVHAIQTGTLYGVLLGTDAHIPANSTTNDATLLRP